MSNTAPFQPSRRTKVVLTPSPGDSGKASSAAASPVTFGTAPSSPTKDSASEEVIRGVISRMDLMAFDPAPVPRAAVRVEPVSLPTFTATTTTTSTVAGSWPLIYHYKQGTEIRQAEELYMTSPKKSRYTMRGSDGWSHIGWMETWPILKKDGTTLYVAPADFFAENCTRTDLDWFYKKHAHYMQMSVVEWKGKPTPVWWSMVDRKYRLGTDLTPRTHTEVSCDEATNNWFVEGVHVHLLRYSKWMKVSTDDMLRSKRTSWSGSEH